MADKTSCKAVGCFIGMIVLGLCALSFADWTEPVRICDLSGLLTPRAVVVGETLHVVARGTVKLYYVRSPDNGVTWTEPMAPADTFYDGSDMPDIGFSNGLLHIAYVGRLPDVPRPQIFVLSSSDGGRNWWRRRHVFNNISYGLKTPRLAVKGDTLFLSCRSDYIWVFRSLDNGETWGDSTMAESGPIAIFQAQNIVYSADYVNLIYPLNIAYDSLGIDIYHRYSSDYGLTWSDRFPLSTLEYGPDSEDGQSPSASGDTSGNILALWFDYKYGSACGFSGDILGRVSLDNGQSWLDETRLTYTQTGHSSSSSILDNKLYSVWGDESPLGCGWPKIMYSESSDWGTSWSRPEVISGPVEGAEFSPVLFYTMSIGDIILHCIFERTFLYHMSNRDITTIGEKEEHIISEDIVLSCYPNPFNSLVSIRFLNPEGGELQVEIYNVNGQKVWSSSSSSKEGSIVWSATDNNGEKVASGIYYVKARTCNRRKTVELIYLK